MKNLPKKTTAFVFGISIFMISLGTGCCILFPKSFNVTPPTALEPSIDPTSIITNYENMSQHEIDELTNNIVFQLESMAENSDLEIDIRKCQCDTTLIMLDFNRPISPLEKERIATVDPEHEETRYNNINFSRPVVENCISRDSTFKLPAAPSGEEIIVAVIDTGLDHKNRILNKHLWRNTNSNEIGCYGKGLVGYDFAADFLGATPDAITDHGTNVAEALVNSINDDIQFKLVDIRIFDEKNKTDLFTTMCAIRYAQKIEADIINMSFGYYTDSITTTADKILQNYLSSGESFHHQILVASAGNEHQNTDDSMHYPSGFVNLPDFENMISASTHENDKLWEKANYGYRTVTLTARGNKSDSDQITGTSISAGTVSARVVETLQHLRQRKYTTNIEGSEVVECIKSSVINLEFPIKTKGKIPRQFEPCEINVFP